MKNGRIAIPSMQNGGLEGVRAGHFGHCDVFTLVDVKDGSIVAVSTIENESHVQGGCMVPVQLLAKHNVNALVVGGIGLRPLMGFKQFNIDVYYEPENANIKPVVDDLIAGKLSIIQNDQVCGGGGGQM
jgi:predicted Fe-Mo cluster-binding NifX family protein